MKTFSHRILAMFLTLLIFCSVLYVDIPKVKCFNSLGAAASLTYYVCKNIPGYDEAIAQGKQSVKEAIEQEVDLLLNSESGKKVKALLKSAAKGVKDTYKATRVIIDSCVSNAKEAFNTTEGSFLNKVVAASGVTVDTVGEAFSDTVYCLQTGGNAVTSLGIAAMNSAMDRVEDSQARTTVTTSAMNILDTYVYKGKLGTNTDKNIRLTAAAWLVSREIFYLKEKGYSDLAIIGTMCNAFSESGFDPYMIQGNGEDKFNEFTMASALTLKIDGDKDPWSIVGTNQSDIDKLLTDGQRVNHRINVAPTSGIGLFQFTDCSNSKPNYGQFLKGYRRSCAINNFAKTTTTDPFTCVLECGTYDYWVPPTNVDNTTTDTISNEDGTTTTIDFNSDIIKQPCEKSTANNKIAMASDAYQIGYFTEEDGPNCWLITESGKQYMEAKGLGDLAGYTFEDFKNFQGTGNFSEDCRKAVTLFLLGEERPASTQNDYGTVDRTVNTRTNQDVISAICEIGGFNGEAGLDLSTIIDSPNYDTSILDKDDVLNGTGAYAHLRALAQSGYYTADELSQSCSGFETNVESELLALADRSYMTNKELYNLVAWENQVETTSFENTLVLMGRKLTLWIGILILVWSVLFYLAYWFDRVNTMFYIDLLGILSLKRLQATDAAENSTYNLSKEELGNKNVRIVAHRDVIKISIIGITLGTMFVTGTIFKILHSLMMWLYNFLT